MTRHRRLARRLGTTDAVVIGLSSMIGAGVFAAFAPAAAAAGSGLLIGLGVAAVVAYGNATSTAQLAARYPVSGGAYVYGRERLGPWWGFVAGWGFVIGKTASCAAMALTVAAYALPDGGWVQRAVAILVVLAVTAVNLRGITRTARTARWLVAGSLTALARGGGRDPRIRPSRRGQPRPRRTPRRPVWRAPGGGPALLRIRRLRADRDSRGRGARTGPDHPARHPGGARDHRRGLRGGGDRGARGPRRGTPRHGEAPLASAVAAVGAAWAEPVVRAGAVWRASDRCSRSSPAWAGPRLPWHGRAICRAACRSGAAAQRPHHAELAVAAAVIVLVALVDLRGAIGFSSFGCSPTTPSPTPRP